MIEDSKLIEPIGNYFDRMPLSDKFWDLKSKSTKPIGIRGFFTALPIQWTEGENNHPDMNKLLLTHIDGQGSSHALTMNDRVSEKEVSS